MYLFNKINKWVCCKGCSTSVNFDFKSFQKFPDFACSHFVMSLIFLPVYIVTEAYKLCNCQ